MSLHLYPEASSKQLRKLNPNDFATTIIWQFFHHVLPQKKQLQPTQPTQHAAASPIRDLHLCQGIWLHERIHVCFEGWNPDGFGGLWGTCTPPHREPTKKKTRKWWRYLPSLKRSQWVYPLENFQWLEDDSCPFFGGFRPFFRGRTVSFREGSWKRNNM